MTADLDDIYREAELEAQRDERLAVLLDAPPPPVDPATVASDRALSAKIDDLAAQRRALDLTQREQSRLLDEHLGAQAGLHHGPARRTRATAVDAVETSQGSRVGGLWRGILSALGIDKPPPPSSPIAAFCVSPHFPGIAAGGAFALLGDQLRQEPLTEAQQQDLARLEAEAAACREKMAALEAQMADLARQRAKALNGLSRAARERHELQGTPTARPGRLDLDSLPDVAKSLEAATHLELDLQTDAGHTAVLMIEIAAFEKAVQTIFWRDAAAMADELLAVHGDEIDPRRERIEACLAGTVKPTLGLTTEWIVRYRRGLAKQLPTVVAWTRQSFAPTVHRHPLVTAAVHRTLTERHLSRFLNHVRDNLRNPLMHGDSLADPQRSYADWCQQAFAAESLRRWYIQGIHMSGSPPAAGWMSLLTAAWTARSR